MFGNKQKDCKPAILLMVMAACVLGIGPSIVSGAVIYVDASAAGSNNGSSWTNAYKYLRDALSAAVSSDEIWVAEGTYKPDANTWNPGGTADRKATFQLISGVEIYGGFPSGGGTWEQRDSEVYETILSGDISTPGDANDNSYHVVTGSQTDANAILDGFTITAGNANGSGTTAYGGGMYNEYGSPTVTNCTFTGNYGQFGGGMLSDWSVSNPTVTNCTFSGNSAWYGGGMYSAGGPDWVPSSPTVTNCTFSGNDGGGMYNDNSNPTVTDCTFGGNNGWGMCSRWHSSPRVANCTFSGNNGGGMLNLNGSSPTVTNCTFSGNSAGHGGGMSNYEYSSPTVSNCTFSDNSAGSGGGMYNNKGSSTVTNCTFSGNSADNDGGGMANSVRSSPKVTNCTFSGNSAGARGGGMRNLWASPTVTNCTFSGNSAGADYGGGIFNEGYTGPTFPWVVNCILWGNTASGWLVEKKQIFDDPSSSTTIYWTCLEGWTGALGGAGNHGDNPLFVDADGPDDIVGTDDDNLRLSPVSACIDAGANAAVPADTADLDNDGNTTEPIPFDLDGNPRILDGDSDGNSVVDMGAYELYIPLVESREVLVDIKPGGCPNPLNLQSRGVLPVAILGTEDFDVNTIDAGSIFLEGVPTIRTNYEDVAAPVTDGNECECNTNGPDGYTDLTLKFRTAELVERIIGSFGELAAGDELVLTLKGALSDGTPIEGSDCVVLVGNVPRALAAMRSDITGDGIVNLYDFAVLAEYWLESAFLEY